MVENFQGVLKKEWYREDLKVFTSHIKEHESLLRLKRRMLPESLLREDDVSYEDIRTCIEIGFGAHDYSKEPYRAAAVKVLDRLEDFPFRALIAMHRKLKGVRDFRKFSPETEALHNDIAKAIHLLDDSKRVSLIELKKVQILLDPNSELSVRSLRMAVRNTFLSAVIWKKSLIV
ncbi:UNVERIFIED_CONTAM: hypothetical protein Sradi_1709700 [Sesamum radiatum]|uniref:Uncharacterized protein n=1 Tax=Sesamum radiatum TaxID=300843 RepID=A0AAW2TT98_SESRA